MSDDFKNDAVDGATKNMISDEPQQKRKFSILSLIALFVSLAAVGLSALALDGKALALWAIMSIVSIILPIIAKAIRISHNLVGRGLDIAAIVIGAFALYFLLFSATKIPILLIYIIVGVCCVIYALIKKSK